MVKNWVKATNGWDTVYRVMGIDITWFCKGMGMDMELLSIYVWCLVCTI